MADMKSKADKVFSAYWNDPCHNPNMHLANILREVINQLQQSPGVIMCADILELCNQLEAL